MVQTAENPVIMAAFPNAKVSQERSDQTKKGIRQTLQQAVDLQQIAFKAAQAIERASNPDELELAQARAKAVYDATKSWDISVDRVRIIRGKPMPGSLRPESKSKPKKSQPNTFTEE